ncbi:MAG TPA: cbb3-type cytochrome oxidase assembly protein CcoS [Gemmatimonadaceae bacterium]|nr:cbb3-type cytochrome oxidase assembly protein CcoS [Gemmatimonadaceae bacterium]
MSVLYVLIPLALAIVVVAVVAYVWSARSGQFDDLETPALRPLIDEESKAPSRRVSRPPHR